MQTFLWRFFADEFGATAIEYALVGSLISVACISGITAVGTSLLGSYTAITAALAFVLPLASGSGFWPHPVSGTPILLGLALHRWRIQKAGLPVVIFVSSIRRCGSVDQFDGSPPHKSFPLPPTWGDSAAPGSSNAFPACGNPHGKQWVQFWLYRRNSRHAVCIRELAPWVCSAQQRPPPKMAMRLADFVYGFR